VFDAFADVVIDVVRRVSTQQSSGSGTSKTSQLCACPIAPVTASSLHVTFSCKCQLQMTKRCP